VPPPVTTTRRSGQFGRSTLCLMTSSRSRIHFTISCPGHWLHYADLALLFEALTSSSSTTARLRAARWRCAACSSSSTPPRWQRRPRIVVRPDPRGRPALPRGFAITPSSPRPAADSAARRQLPPHRLTRCSPKTTCWPLSGLQHMGVLRAAVGTHSSRATVEENPLTAEGTFSTSARMIPPPRPAARW